MGFGKLSKYLILHLSRFEFDFNAMRRKKLNSRFEFPLNLNMQKYTKEGIAQIEAQKRREKKLKKKSKEEKEKKEDEEKNEDEDEEAFHTVSLTVKNKSSLKESLELYVKGDILDGDNKWLCSECDAKRAALKRSCFGKLSKYLILHLSRFEFDFNAMRRKKLNSRFEFPLNLNMQK